MPRILLWERQEDAHGPEGHRSYLEVVGSRHIPKALDRAALASELAQCTTWHEVAYGVTDLAQAKRDIKHLEAINKVARRLDLLFVSNDLVRHELAGELPGGMAALEGVVRGLIEITDRSLAPYREPVTAANCEAELEKCLIREAEIEKHLIAAIDDMHGPQTNTPSVLDEVRSREGSALEWLVGKRLSDIFERHFGARATLARSTGGDSYCKEWDEKHGTYKSQPVHNWASHGSDALQTGACGFVPDYVPPPNDRYYRKPRRLSAWAA